MTRQRVGVRGVPATRMASVRNRITLDVRTAPAKNRITASARQGVPL